MTSNSSSPNISNERAMGRALSALSFLYGAGEIDERKYTKILYLLGRNEDFLSIKDNNSDMPSSISRSPHHAVVPIKLVGDTLPQGIEPNIRKEVRRDLYDATIPKKGGTELSQDDVFGTSGNSSSPEDSSSQSLSLQTASDNSNSRLTNNRANRQILQNFGNIDYPKPVSASTPRPRTSGREPMRLPRKMLENSISSTFGSLVSVSSPTPVKISSEMTGSTLDRKPVIRQVCNTLQSTPATVKIQAPTWPSHANVYPFSSGGNTIINSSYRPCKSSGLRFSKNAEGHASPLNERDSLEPIPIRPAENTGNQRTRKSDIPKLINISDSKEDEEDDDETDGCVHLGAENDGASQNATGADDIKNAEGADAVNYGIWEVDSNYDNAAPKGLASSGSDRAGTDFTLTTTPLRSPTAKRAATPSPGTPYRPDGSNSSHGHTTMAHSTHSHRPQLPRPTSAETNVIVCPWWSTYGSCSMRGCPFQHRNLEAGIYQRLICPYWLGLHPTIPRCKHDAETCRFAHIEAKHAQWAPFSNWAKF